MNKQEQDFEEKIRKKLSVDPEGFDEAAWEKLERRLEPGRPRKAGMLTLWWFRGAAAVILAGAGALIYSSIFNPGKPGPGSSGSQEQVDTNLPAGSGNGGENTVAPLSGEPGAGSDAAGKIENAGAARPATENAPAGIAAENPESPVAGNITGESPGELAAGAGSGVSSKGLPGSDDGDLLQTLVGARVSVPSGLGIVWPLKEVPLPGNRAPYREGLALAEPELAAVTGSASPGRNAALEGLPVRPAPDQVNVGGRQGEAPEDSQQGSQPESPAAGSGAETRGIGFSLGVLAAPDLNSVGGMGDGKVGYHAGLTLGVRFGDRLSLETGVVYSKKPYDASPSDYHRGRPSSSLLAINAECDVIDIPVNLRYDFYRKGANRAALTTGLSSYLMLSERYRYRYQDYDSRLYEYRNENQHFMGVANMGIAFERKLNSKMSIGLQPFIKIPLTGIGHGKVKLISTGAAVRLSMRLGQK